MMENYDFLSENDAIVKQFVFGINFLQMQKCPSKQLHKQTQAEESQPQYHGVSTASSHSMQNGKTHFWANVFLLGPVCLFWHEID